MAFKCKAYHQKRNTTNLVVHVLMITLLIEILSAEQNDETKSTTPPSQLDFARLGKYKMSRVKLFDSHQDILNSTEIERDDKDDPVTERPGPESRAGSFQRHERKMKHMENFTLTVEMDGKTFTLDLTINRFLLSSNYTETLVNSTRRERMNVDLFSTHCYYLGTARGYENSSAAVSTCNGITGAIFIGEESYYIEPDSDSESCLSCSHKIYKSSDQPPELKNLGCGTSHHHFVNPNFARRRKRAPINEWPQGIPGKTRIVEVFAISDHNQFTKYSGDLTVINQRARDMINTASLLYHSEDIYLVLVGLEVWADTDRVPISSPRNSTQLLYSFCDYSQKNVTQRRDITLYLTSVGPFDLPSSVVGKAFVDRMCGENSCAFTADLSTTGQAGVTTAHEFGHVFGLNHDGDTTGRCPTSCDQAGGLCIMNSVGGSNNVKWSTCSSTILKSSDTYNKFTCLNNLPSTLYEPTAPKCGNGLVETGEQCDCGQAPTSECNPACCNNVTCQLIAPAECAFGKCCSVATCKLTARYTECRSTSGVCDLSEYCSGTDHLCPSDVYKVDFSSCTIAGNAGYCRSGKCNNRQNQCQTLFGTSATVADDSCYTFWNAQTTYPQYRYVGNCGYVTPGDYDNYFPCAQADAFCGQAQCTGGTLQFTNAYSSQGTISGTIVCYQAHFTVPISDGNLGYIQDGSPCGTGKVCQGQKCVNLTAVSSSSSCSNCSGNGVCNNLYQCHCNVGYAPPQCNQPGEGGSLHSGGIVPLPSTSTTTITSSTTSSTTLSTSSSRTSSTTLSTSPSTTSSTTLSTSPSTTSSTTLSTSPSTTSSTTLSTSSSTTSSTTLSTTPSTTSSTTLSTSSSTTSSTTLSTSSSTTSSTTLSTSSSTKSSTTLSTTPSTTSSTTLSTSSSTTSSTTISATPSTISSTTKSTTTILPSSFSSTTLSSSTATPSSSSISASSTTRTSTTTSPSSTNPSSTTISSSSKSPSTTTIPPSSTSTTSTPTSTSSTSPSTTTSPSSSSPSSTTILPSSISSSTAPSISSPTSTTITPSSTSPSSAISVSNVTPTSTSLSSLSSSTPASTGASKTGDQEISSKTTPTGSGQNRPTSTPSTTTEPCTDSYCDTWVIIVSVILGTVVLFTVFYFCYRFCFRRYPTIHKPIRYDNPTARSVPVRIDTRQQAGFDPFNRYA